MSYTATNDNKDRVVGFVRRGSKGDGSPAEFFEVFLYELDEAKMPIKIGTWEDKDGKKHPKYKLAGVLKFAQSSFTRMASAETRKCHLYMPV